MIIISDSLALSEVQPKPATANNPVIGWRSVVTADGLSTDSEVVAFPVSNLANVSTAEKWRADETGALAIEVAIAEIDDVDYVGIAAHNWGTAGVEVTIEGKVEEEDEWAELVQPFVPVDDEPIIARFEPQGLGFVRLSLGAGSVAAEAAVLYVGRMSVMQRRVYVGHRPITYARQKQTYAGRSASGHYLGTIVERETRSTGLSLQNLTPSWYRDELDPYVKVCRTTPAFFAWRPGKYPREVGFVWASGDPMPDNQLANGMMSIDFDFDGIGVLPS